MLELRDGVLIMSENGFDYEVGITLEDVIKRLAHLGYTATAEDNDHITYELTKIVNYTLNY